MKIEFGCGNKGLPEGWVGCDIRKLPSVRFVCNAWEIADLVPAGSVEEVASRHMLEHLTFHDARRTLVAWHTILSEDGSGRVTVPDMSFHLRQWQEGRDDPREFAHALAGFWGWQKEADQGEVWDVHKSGYDERLLTEMLRAVGFRNVVREDIGPAHLSLRFAKFCKFPLAQEGEAIKMP